MNLREALGELEQAVQDVEVSTYMVRVIEEAIDYFQCGHDNEATIASLALTQAVVYLRDATERLSYSFSNYHGACDIGIDVT